MSPAAPTDAAASASLRLVGRVHFHDRSGGEVPLPTRKVRALLAIVALSAEGTVSRQKLCSLLWEDRGEAQARGSLRQAVHELKRALDLAKLADALTVDRDVVGLDRRCLAVDVLVDPPLAATIDLNALVARLKPWQADLMEDLDGIGPALDDWLRDERAARRDTLVRALMARLQSEPPSDAALRVAQAVVAMDPAHEPAHRFLMAIHAAQQNVGGALAHYHRLEGFFEREFGATPHESTRGAALGLTEAPTATFQQPITAAANRRPRLRLAAFAELGDDETTRQVGGMLRDDLALMLERSQEAEIATHDGDAPAHDPTVDLVLHANLRSTGSAVRIYLWLIRPGNNARLWSERFDLALEAGQPIEDGDTARMAAAVLAALVRRMAAPSSATLRGEADAYRVFVRARDLVDGVPDRTRLREALTLLEQAVQADPANLIARIYLVRLLNTQLFETEVGADPGPWRAWAREVATRAYEIDPRSAEANVVMGWCHLRQRRFGEARWFIEEALAINPYHPERQADAATAFMYLGDHERAMLCLSRSLKMDAQRSEKRWGDALEIHALRGDFDTALATVSRVRSLDVKRVAWVCVAASYAGDRARAEESAQRLVELGRDLWIGRTPFTPAGLVEWLLLHLPFAEPRDKARFLAGLRSAGLDI